MALGPPEASRRALLTSAGVAGTGVVLTAASAQAEGRGKPTKYQGMKLLKPRERHLVSRFSYGVTPALAAQVRAAGGARAWWEQQLNPGAISDGFADQLAELVALARAEPAGDVGAGQDGHDARLRRVPGLPALRAAAAHLLQPPGARR